MKGMFLTGELNENSMKEVVELLLQCKKEADRAFIMISSGGGLVNCLKAIHDVLEATKVPLTTIGMGHVESSAAALFCMGDTRILLPNTEFMMHNSSRGWNKPHMLNTADMQYLCRDMQETNEWLISVECKKTKLTPEVFEEKYSTGKDWILTPEEVKQYGITTQSYSDRWVDIVTSAMK